MIITVIAARGGSKSIPQKNLVSFAGAPLLVWSLQYARQFSDVVLVSSDSSYILNFSTEYGALAIKRPENLSTDTSSSEEAWLHALDEFDAADNDTIIALQATSPLRSLAHVSQALEILKQDECDSIFSARSIDDMLLWRHTLNGLQEVNFNNTQRTMRQTKTSKIIQENGSFYLFSTKNFKRHKTRLHKNILPLEQDSIYSEQIDEPGDINLLESIYLSNPSLFFSPF